MFSPAMLFRSGTESTVTVHDRKENAATHTYTINVSGQSISTTVTSNSDVVVEWINAVMRDRHAVGRLVGIEMEFQNDTPLLCTVQLCMKIRCLVFQVRQPSRIGILDHFLANRDNFFAFVGTNVRARMVLHRLQFGFSYKVGNCRDLTELPPALWDEKTRLMAANDFPDFTTDFARGSQLLTIAQINHACLNAYFNTVVARI